MSTDHAEEVRRPGTTMLGDPPLKRRELVPIAAQCRPRGAHEFALQFRLRLDGRCNQSRDVSLDDMHIDYDNRPHASLVRRLLQQVGHDLEHQILRHGMQLLAVSSQIKVSFKSARVVEVRRQLLPAVVSRHGRPPEARGHLFCSTCAGGSGHGGRHCRASERRWFGDVPWIRQHAPLERD